MPFMPPIIDGRFTKYQGEIISTHLALAIWLVDATTGRTPLGNVKIFLKEEKLKALKNLSGYFCFNDLLSGLYIISVDSDYYFNVNKTVFLPLPEPKNPVIEIILYPKPNYPFSDQATLVRGLVSDGEPIVDAEINVVGKAIQSSTNKKGEFVLQFKGIKQESITIEITKYGRSVTVNAQINEKKITSLGVIKFP